jgi:hypothetical protein
VDHFDRFVHRIVRVPVDQLGISDRLKRLVSLLWERIDSQTGLSHPFLLVDKKSQSARLAF